MQEDIQIDTERIDDFVVLLALIQQMDQPAILDRHLSQHWLQYREAKDIIAFE